MAEPADQPVDQQVLLHVVWLQSRLDGFRRTLVRMLWFGCCGAAAGQVVIQRPVPFRLCTMGSMGFGMRWPGCLRGRISMDIPHATVGLRQAAPDSAESAGNVIEGRLLLR